MWRAYHRARAHDAVRCDAVHDACGVPRLWSSPLFVSVFLLYAYARTLFLNLVLSRSLSVLSRAHLTFARWRWVVEAPAAAPFDLPDHAPFFHFFTP